MKNIFVKTALALFLIPGFLLTSVGSAQAEWTHVPGAAAGQFLFKLVIPVEYQALFSPESLCLPLGLDTPIINITYPTSGPNVASYAQFAADADGYMECWYYDSDTAKGVGEGGENTWRWDN